MSQSEEYISKHTKKVDITANYSAVTPHAIKNDEISLKEIILKLQEWRKYLLSKWLIILTAGVIGGVLGLLYASSIKPYYTAETTFVLEEGEASDGLGQYSGVASMLGVDLGGSGGGIFKGDNILELYKSRKMIQETLLAKDTFNGIQQLLIERYLSFNNIRESWESNPKLRNLSFEKASKFNRLQDSIIGAIVETINGSILKVAKPDKSLSIISVSVKSNDELFAKSFAKNIVKTVNAFYINTKTKKSIENVTILEDQVDSIRNVLNASIAGVASAIDANPNINPAFQKLRVSSQKKQIDVQANGAIYQEIVKNLEMAKVTLRNDKPLIQIIDEPVLPLKKEKIGKLKGLISGGLLFGLVSILILFGIRIFNSIME